MHRIVLGLLTVITFVFHPAQAQEASSPTPAAAQASQQDPATLNQRIGLATKMHEIRPTRDQVNAAIDQVAQAQPANEREDFKLAMRNVLNYKAIEKISVDAMADVYTVQELQAMVDYYSKPEAKSAAEKDKLYGQKVYPEIIRMLDQAMMKVRTGGDSAAPPGPGQAMP